MASLEGAEGINKSHPISSIKCHVSVSCGEVNLGLGDTLPALGMNRYTFKRMPVAAAQSNKPLTSRTVASLKPGEVDEARFTVSRAAAQRAMTGALR